MHAPVAFLTLTADASPYRPVSASSRLPEFIGKNAARQKKGAVSDTPSSSFTVGRQAPSCIESITPVLLLQDAMALNLFPTLAMAAVFRICKGNVP
jgi:hypothetical protein